MLNSSSFNVMKCSHLQLGNSNRIGVRGANPNWKSDSNNHIKLYENHCWAIEIWPYILYQEVDYYLTVEHWSWLAQSWSFLSLPLIWFGCERIRFDAFSNFFLHLNLDAKLPVFIPFYIDSLVRHIFYKLLQDGKWLLFWILLQFSYTECGNNRWW